jgi:predicted small integral membrane protein/uncharacterized membrane protein (DUF485 family)
MISMLTENPFAGLAASVSPGVMQAFVVAMIAFVAFGTIYDMRHKRSARYFFDTWRKSRNSGKKPVAGGEMASLLIQTAAVDVFTSGEFCNQRRRIAHLLTMYGFVFYAVTTVIMVFRYPASDQPTPAVLPALWHLGALMVCIGGYWFWFFLRVDVVAEGNSPFRVVRADLFVLSLLANATLALVWSSLQASGSGWTTVFLALYVLSAVGLFGSVAWSKFSHMFYKPAAAFQKRVEDANGFGSNLPSPANKPAIFGSDRRPARHY